MARDINSPDYTIGVIGTGTMGRGIAQIAVTGGLLTCFIMFYLWYTGFGSKHRYDVIVNLHWSRDADELADLGLLLERHSNKSHCASQRSHEGCPGAVVLDLGRPGQIVQPVFGEQSAQHQRIAAVRAIDRDIATTKVGKGFDAGRNHQRQLRRVALRHDDAQVTAGFNGAHHMVGLLEADVESAAAQLLELVRR